MPVLDINDPRLGGLGGQSSFTSPFPSIETQRSDLFKALMREVERTPGVPEGVLAARQARAWSEASRVAMRARFSSPMAGGLRTDWLPKVTRMEDDPASGLSLLRGMFADVNFQPSVEPAALRQAAVNVGLDVAQNVLAAVPVVGNVLSAAVGFGRRIWSLLSRSRAQQEVRIPWQEFSRDLDGAVINDAVVPLMQSVDWTLMFAPALDPNARRFELRKTKKGGKTRAWGVFTPGGEPDYVGGLGMLPGMEVATHIVQVARAHETQSDVLDVTTDVASFLPSFTQFATTAWQQANKGGNPDMYKVRAGDLEVQWRRYFARMFADAWERWDAMSTFDRLFTAKALTPFIRRCNPVGGNRAYGTISLESFAGLEMKHGPVVGPGMFDDDWADPIERGAKYRRVDEMYVLPAVRRLKQRQKSMLARTVVSALVRIDDVNGMPAFAAFSDRSAPLSSGYSTFGEELRDYARQMREKLLAHPARFELAHAKPGSVIFERHAPDVRVVDPPFASKLERSFGSGLSLRDRPERGLAVAPLEPESPPPDPVWPPGGGPPFPTGSTHGGGGGWGWPLAAAALGIAGVGTAVVGKKRGWW